MDLKYDEKHHHSVTEVEWILCELKHPSASKFVVKDESSIYKDCMKLALIIVFLLYI